MADGFDELTVSPEDFEAAQGAMDPDPFGQLLTPREPEADFAAKANAAIQGGYRGAVQGATAASGLVAGAQVGMAAGAMTGPAAPVAVPALGVVGAGVGAVAGFMAGDALSDGLAKVYIPGSSIPITFESLAAVPEALRPYAVMGETIGGAVAPAGAPYIIGKTGVKFGNNLVGRYIDGLVNTAKNQPYTFALIEAQMAFGSGIGAGAAEALAPGSSNVRMTGEVVGGLLNPTAIATKSARYGVELVKNAVTNLSPAVQENKAAALLRQIVNEFGEDPVALARKLREADPVLGNLPLTTGQKSGSAAILELEAKLKQTSTQFGGEAAKQGGDALEFMRQAILHLNSTGDPQALKKAAELQKVYYDNLLEGTRRDAEHRVLEAMAAFDPTKAGSRSDFGRQATTIVSEAMDSVRNVERQLWEAVPKETPVGVDNIVQHYGRIRGTKRLESETLPPVIEKEVAKFAEARANSHVAGTGTEVSTIGYLQIFRSRMLALSREAAADNKWADASTYGELAEAALDDMTASADDATSTALTAARDWSRQLHERFSQTFAGDVIRRADDGGARLPPELVMVRAFGAGKEMGELQFRQLQEAAHMAGQEYVTRITKVQEDTLRFAASELFVNGTVNGNRLRSFRSKNKELLARFPEMDRQLQNADSAQAFFERTQEGIAATQREIRESMAFAKIIGGGEDPATAVGKALEGVNPVQDINAIWKLAKDSGKDATEGAQAAVWSYLYNKAVRANGDFSFNAYRQSLEQPPTPSGKPMKDILVNAGVVGQKHMDRLFEVLDRASKIEEALAARVPLDKIIADEGPLFDTVYRVVGTKLAALVPGQHNSLVIAGSMSRSVRQIMDRIPKSKIKDVLLHASRDPEFAAFLLEKSSDPKRRVEWAQQMNVYLWQAGIGGWARDEEDQGYSE